MRITPVFSLFPSWRESGFSDRRSSLSPFSSQLPLPSSFPNASPSFTLSLEVALAVDSWLLEEQRYHQADDPPAPQDSLRLSSPEHH